MIDDTIILLIHYYDSEEANHRLLKYMIKNWCGIYLPFDMYLGEPLQKTFSRVIIYDYLKRRAEIGIKAVNAEVIALVRKEHPKYLLWTSWQYDIQPSTLDTVRKEGTTVVGWFFDDEWRFDNYSRWWIPHLDYCVTHGEAVPKYEKIGARVIPTLQNTGVATERDWSNIEEKYDVSFVGSKSADREQQIDELRKRNVRVSVFGEGWGGYVSFEEMIEVFKTSKINLNFSGTYYATLGIKGRIFQVCLAGGFLLTEYVTDIEDYFEIDKEIVCFHNADEMMAKIGYYLNHEVERRAIAQAGWGKATSKYTSFHLVSKVFSQIEQDLIARKDEKVIPTLHRLKMPMWERMIPSQYHFQWGRVLMEENYKKGLWKDPLALSLSYNPFNIWVWYYYMVSLLPSFLRPILFKLYGAMERTPRVLYYWLGSMPYLKKIMQTGLVKRAVLHLRM